MPRPRKDAPEGIEPIPVAVQQLSGFSTEEEMLKAMPDNSNEEDAIKEDKPRRKRRTKDEMAASRGADDPMMADKRYREAIERMNGYGGPRVIKTVFGATSKPLDDQEELEVDDYFYVLSKRHGLDPSRSNVAMFIYAFLLFARILGMRLMGGTSIDLAHALDNFFGGKKEKKEDAK